VKGGPGSVPQLGNSAGAFFASPAAKQRYLAHLKRGAGIAGKQRAALGFFSSPPAPHNTTAVQPSVVFESLKLEAEIRYDSGKRSGGLDPFVEVVGNMKFEFPCEVGRRE
jgi:hypothetical protein